MLDLNLAELSRGEARVQGEISPDDPFWEEPELRLAGPLAVDLVASSVGEGVLVRGKARGRWQLECRRCLSALEEPLDEQVEFFFEEMSAEEELELEGEVYPLPEGAGTLSLAGPVREQLLLRAPRYALCREECRGLCARCGTDLNLGDCGCMPEPTRSPWDALRQIVFE